MIHHLVEYARNTSLDAEQGFAPKYAKWAIECAPDGRYLGLLPLGDAADKRNKGMQFSKCPDLTQGEMITGGAGTRHFLLDTAAVVAHWGKEAESEKEGEGGKAHAKHQCFQRMLSEAGQTVPSIAAAANCLSEPSNQDALRRDLATQKARETDNVTFLVEGRFSIAGAEWHDWWRDYRCRFSKPVSGKEKARRMRCLVSGELVAPALTHEQIRGLSSVGAKSMASFVSFDKESFCSYGLEQSANAAMSAEMVKAYQSGLNDLIEEGFLLGGGKKKAGNLIVHWFRNKVEDSDNPWPFLTNPETEELDARQRARAMLASIRNGENASLANNTYYALTLSGAGGRVMVRDWMEGPFEQLVGNIAAWFDDLDIIAPDGRSHARAPKFMAVLGATVRELDDLPAPFIAQMWRVAVRNQPIPRSALSTALTRLRADVLAGESPRLAGVGLLKAWHLRHNRTLAQKENTMPDPLQPELNPDHPSVAYQCGCLLALFAKMQDAAMPNVKSSVVQRYYASASTTPALVLGRLVRGAQIHRDKIASERPGLAVWFDQKIGGVMSRLRQPPPSTFTLEEQSLFAIGYYQQLANRSEEKKED